MSGETLTIRRVFPVSLERMFQAWTEPATMGRWFFVGDEWSCRAQAELKVGGEYRLLMRTETGEQLECRGVYQEIVPLRRVAFTWNSHLHIGSLVVVDMRPVDGGTELTITHTGLPTADLREAHRQGWIGCLEHLAQSEAN